MIRKHVSSALFLAALLLMVCGCDSFLGVPLEDQEYSEPELSLFSPLRVVEALDTIRVQVVAKGGSDYYFGDEQHWWTVEGATFEKSWLRASFLAPTQIEQSWYSFRIFCEVLVGGNRDQLDPQLLGTIINVYPDLVIPYRGAIRDAAIAFPEEAVDTLWSLSLDAPYLRHDYWRGSERIQLVTWTQYDTYDERLHDTLTTWWGSTWVAIPSQVRRATAWEEYHADEAHLRLAQYLGLPPDTPKDRMVILSVRLEDLFRPSMDPEIDDRSAGLTWSEAADSAYRAWFEAEKNYTDNGYPWTRLGYTYDWGNPGSEVGASEYVIRPGSVVLVRWVFSTLEFLQNDWSDYYYYYY